jgi:RNA polymerase sigma-70 factor (ECF subfamily)
MKTSGSEWPDRLARGSADRDAALVELRLILLKGLRAGLSVRQRIDDDFIEDVVQVALVRMLDHLEKFEGRSAFTTWALAIAFRVAFSELRRKQWKNVSLEELRDRIGSLREEVKQTPDPGEEAERSRLVAMVHRLIRTKLTPRQRDVLLAMLNAMPQDEIARQMSITRNAVYKLGHDARKALRKAFEEAGYGIEQVRDILGP